MAGGIASVMEPPTLHIWRGLRYTLVVPDATDRLAQLYVRHGYPSAEELIFAQGLTFPRDPHELLGDFWPEEESIDDFLSAMREWRGHVKTDPAA